MRGPTRIPAQPEHSASRSAERACRAVPWQMPASSKKAKTENSASPAPKGAASAAMEEDSPDAEAPPAEEDEDATLAPSQMEKALNEVADARSDANDAKAASASASPAKSQSPAKVAAAKSEEQPAATPAKEEEHPAPSSAEKAEGAVKDTAQEGGDDVMVVDDDSGDAEQGGVKQDKDASPAKSPAKPAEQVEPPPRITTCACLPPRIPGGCVRGVHELRMIAVRPRVFLLPSFPQTAPPPPLLTPSTIRHLRDPITSSPPTPLPTSRGPRAREPRRARRPRS